MKALMSVAALAAALVASPAFAGRDLSQLVQQDEQNRAVAAKNVQMRGQSAAGPAGRAGREGEPGTRQMELLKQFHPKQAYGPPSGR